MNIAAVGIRRTAVALLAAALTLTMLVTAPPEATGHELDHPAEGFAPSGPLASGVNSGGEGAEWELISSIPTGNPHTDIEFFTQGGETFAAVGTLGAGPNAGGQTIVQLTNEGEVDPAFLSAHPSASCVSNPAAALGLQHDVEATPKGPDIFNNASYLPPVSDDAQLIVDATDAEGRCHDQGDLGFSGAPQGGLEIVDITDISNPVEIGLTSHIGESHTVNIDPKRPHIAYSVTSDSVGVTTDDNGTPDDVSDDTFTRNNEESGMGLDGFEVVDLSSCMAPPYGTMDVDPSLEGQELTDAKREQCRPETYRYRWPTVDMALGHTSESNIYGCHELEIYPDDRLTCGSGPALILLDMAGAFDDMGTPDDFTDDKPRGTPLPCFERESTSSATPTGATIMDCVNGGDDGSQSLIVSEYPEGDESLEGVEWLGTAYHQGRGAGTYNSLEDIDFNHEAELTHSGRFAIATDERGGGVTPPGATCDPADLNLEGNGGIHAYQVDELKTERPVATTDEEEAEMAFESYARGTDGEKAVFRAPIRTQPQATVCTAHVMQQIPGQNRIFMGWYSQGTQVIDYVELPGGRFEWIEDQAAQEGGEGETAQPETSQAGWFIPESANTWVSHIFDMDENEDGTFTYFGATGDFNLGSAGRNAIDVYQVTLPAPADVCTLAVESEVEDRDRARETHRSSVDCVLHYDIARGTSDTTYGPGIDVTREQMASFVVNTIEAAGAGDKLPAPGGADQFDDIRNSDHRGSINRLAAAGIIRGTGGRDFSPARKINREQMATFMVAAARFATGDDYEAERDDYFGDVDEDNPHRGNINGGFEHGLFTGTTTPTEDPDSGEFSPERVVKRDQMATFLIRLFKPSIQ